MAGANLDPSLMVASLAASTLKDIMDSGINAFHSRVDGLQQEQSRFNYSIAREISGLDHTVENLSSKSNEICTRTDNLYDQFRKSSVLVDGLQRDMCSLQTNTSRLDSQLQQYQAKQHDFNLATLERAIRMEEQTKMVNQQQGLFNNDILSRTKAQQNELNMNNRQINERMDRQFLALSTTTEKQANFEANQSAINNKLFNHTESLAGKQLATDIQLEKINLRTDTLREDQTKTDFDIKQEKQFNQNLAERNARIEEKQNCLINELDKINNRVEKELQQFYNTAKKVESVNYKVGNLQDALNKIEIEQKVKNNQWFETTKKVDVVEHSIGNLRDEQREMREQVHKLLEQVSAISVEIKTIGNRLDTLQAEHKVLNEKFIKFEATNQLVSRLPESSKN